MKLLISTGEVSGDLQGSLLIKALKDNAEKRNIKLEIITLGGERMREAGVNTGFYLGRHIQWARIGQISMK